MSQLAPLGRARGDLVAGTGVAIVLLASALGSGAAASTLPDFFINDCNQYNNPCGSIAGNCDDIYFILTPPRVTISDGRGQFVLTVENGAEARTGLEIEMALPPCARLNCSRPCVDTTCNERPDSPPVRVVFSDGGSASPPECDEATSTLRLRDIALGPGETLDVRACGNYVEDGLCCTQAILRDSATGEERVARDWYNQWNPAIHCPGCIGLCVFSGEPVFWKDDCGPYTGDAEDCDDVYKDRSSRVRSVPSPAAGRRVKWVFRAYLGAGPTRCPPELHDRLTGPVRLEDALPLDQTLACRPQDDPLGEGWGCFEIYVDGVARPPSPFTDECHSGPGGTFVVRHPYPSDAVLEVRVCTRINDAVTHRTCNQAAWLIWPWIQVGDNAAIQCWSGIVDPFLGTHYSACIDIGDGRVRALKTIANAGDAPFGPGDRVVYRIDLCETSGAGDVRFDFSDTPPPEIVEPELLAPVLDGCRISPTPQTRVLCERIDIPASTCRSFTWEGRIACAGVNDGDRICNQGFIPFLRVPWVMHPLYTDDPDDPSSDRQPTCLTFSRDRIEATMDVRQVEPAGRLPECEETVRLRYEVVLTSTGSRPASQVFVRGTLPEEVAYVAGSARLDGAPVADGHDPGPPATLAIAAGTLPPGTTRTVTYDVTLPATREGVTVSNQALAWTADGETCGMPERSSDATLLAAGVRYQPTATRVACPFPILDDLTKEVSAAAVPRGEVVTYTAGWCNAGEGAALDVRFEDRLDDCLEHVETRLDGVAVADPFACGAAPGDICFPVTGRQEPGECHVVTIDALLSADAGACPDGLLVTNRARVWEATGEEAEAEAEFELAPARLDLRRMDVRSLSPLQPPKNPTTWGDLDAVGACEPATPRHRVRGSLVEEPSCTCLAGEGEPGGEPLTLWEVAGGGCANLFVARTDCTGDGVLDLELRFLGAAGDPCP